MSLKISVIVPVYNSEKYLDKCIQSIINQTYKFLEIVLIDDGSTDNSAEICEKYKRSDSRIQVIHQKNSGPAIARNTGLKIATGDYISFVDSDDYISENAYETLVKYLDHQKIDVLNFGHYCVNPLNGQCKEVPTKGIPHNVIISKSDMREYIKNANKNTFLWFSCRNIFRRELLENNSIYFVDKILSEDSIFNMQAMLYADSVLAVDDVLYYYVQTSDSLTRKKHTEKHLEKLELLYYEKIKIYNSFEITDWQKDLYQYTVDHTLNLLIANAFASKETCIGELKDIANSQMIRESFKNAKYHGTYKLRIIKFLLKHKLLFLLSFIVRIY